MKQAIFFLLSIICINIAYAQTTYDIEASINQIEAQLQQTQSKISSIESSLSQKDKQIAALQSEIEIIKEINDDLKQKYKLFQGEQSITGKKGVEIKLVSIVGNKTTGQVDVEFLVNNPTDETVFFGPKSFRLTNEVGDEVVASKRSIGAHTKEVGVYLQPNTPLKMFVTFENVVKSSKYARNINFRLDVEFESIDGMQIDWK